MKKKTAICNWTRGLQFIGNSDSCHAVVMDTTFGEGTDTGPTPVEMLLMGLLGCTGMDVVSILKKKRKELAFLEISCEAEWTEEFPRYFKTIHIRYRAAGPDLDETSLARAVSLSSEKYCSVSKIISGTAEITHGIELLHAIPQGSAL